jgi:hypothetical protein
MGLFSHSHGRKLKALEKIMVSKYRLLAEARTKCFYICIMDGYSIIMHDRWHSYSVGK